MKNIFKKLALAGLLALAPSYSNSSAQLAPEVLVEKAERAMLPYHAQCEISNGAIREVTGRGFLFNDKFYLVPYHISKGLEESYRKREEEEAGKKLEVKETTYPIKEGFVNLSNSRLKFISSTGNADFHLIQLDEKVARQYRKEKRFLTAKPTKHKEGEQLYFLRGNGFSDNLMINPFTKKPVYEKTSISFVPTYRPDIIISTFLRNCESGTPFLDSSGNVRGFATSTYLTDKMVSVNGTPLLNRRGTIGDMNVVLKGIEGKDWFSK